jgi:hypothetical protein
MGAVSRIRWCKTFSGIIGNNSKLKNHLSEIVSVSIIRENVVDLDITLIGLIAVKASHSKQMWKCHIPWYCSAGTAKTYE